MWVTRAAYMAAGGLRLDPADAARNAIDASVVLQYKMWASGIAVGMYECQPLCASMQKAASCDTWNVSGKTFNLLYAVKSCHDRLSCSEYKDKVCKE